MKEPDKYYWRPIESVDDWRIPYIGRSVNRQFYEQFESCGNVDGGACTCWRTEVDYHEDESFGDVSSWRRSCLVLLIAKGVNQGLVRSVVIEHVHHESTDSDWRDMHHSATSVSYSDDIDDPRKCCDLLDCCTIDRTDEILFNMARHFLELCPKLSLSFEMDKGLYRGKECVLGLRDGLIHQAYSFPEVFFSPEFVLGGTGWLKGLSRGDAEATLTGCSRIFDCIDIRSFYDGFDYDQLRRTCIDRFRKSVLHYQNLMGYSDALMRAVISARMTEVLALDKREHQCASRLGIKVDSPWCNSVLWDMNSVEHNSIRLPKAACVKKGSLFVFDQHNSCLGYVTDDLCVYSLDQNLQSNKVGWSRPDGTVYRYESQDILGKFKLLKGVNKQGGRWDNVCINEKGRVFDRGIYLGYVRICSNCKFHEVDGWQVQLEQFCAGRMSDVKLFGLAFLGPMLHLTYPDDMKLVVLNSGDREGPVEDGDEESWADIPF